MKVLSHIDSLRELTSTQMLDQTSFLHVIKQNLSWLIPSFH